MKPTCKIAACILLSGIIVFASCKKEKSFPFIVSPVAKPPDIVKPPAQVPDTLHGKEFIFNDLTWVLAGPGAVAETEIWIGVENRPDLFSNPERAMEVSIKFDSSVDWMDVPKWVWPAIPANNGYLYVIMYNSSFYVESYPLNMLLPDTRVSLKIKFL